MIAAGVHLPLSLKAMEYWDDNSDVKDDLNFTAARAAYTTATQLEPGDLPALVPSTPEPHR